VIGLQLTAIVRVPPTTDMMKTDRDQYWILGSARLTKVWNSFLGKKDDNPGQLIFPYLFRPDFAHGHQVIRLDLCINRKKTHLGPSKRQNTCR
jgi:hypothetical protein